MPGTTAIIIIGGGGNGPRTNTEYDTVYNVAPGDTVENSASGAVELHFTGTFTGYAVIPLAGLSGHEFTEAGSFVIYQ